MNKKLLLIALLAGTLNADALSNKKKKDFFRGIVYASSLFSYRYDSIQTLDYFDGSMNNVDCAYLATDALVKLVVSIGATEYLAAKLFDEEDENN